MAQITAETVKAGQHQKLAEPGWDEEGNGQDASRRGSNTAKRAVANNRR